MRGDLMPKKKFEATSKPQTAEELNKALAGFTGTAKRYRHFLVQSVEYTEGIKAMADLAGAYWLIDEVAFFQRKYIRNLPFQLWRLEVKDNRGLLTMREDTNEPLKVKKPIKFTDFPEGVFEFYVCKEGDRNIIMLKSEY